MYGGQQDINALKASTEGDWCDTAIQLTPPYFMQTDNAQTSIVQLPSYRVIFKAIQNLNVSNELENLVGFNFHF